MNRPWVAIQRNPNSGSGRRKSLILDLVAALKRVGLRPRVFSRRDRLDARLQDPEARANLVCIVAAGGDGTIADVVNRFPGQLVCPFPLGTENVLCKYLKIPPNGEVAAELIARGRQRSFDLGRVDDRRFLMMAGIGFDGNVVHQVHAARRGNIGKSAYLKPLWQTTFNYRFPLTTVLLDDDPTPVKGSLVMVANLPCYAWGFPIVPHASGDDGLLDVVIFPNPGSLRLIGYGFDVMTGRHLQKDGIIFRRASRIQLQSDLPVPVQTDGDPAGTTPCLIQVEPRAMRLIVP